MAAALAAAGDVAIAGIAANGIDAIAMIRALKPDCAILDLSMPGANGMEVFLECRRWSPETRVVVVTGNHLPGVMQELAEAGVHGLFMKNDAADALIAGILAVASGETRISPSVAAAIADTAAREKLTARELEILHGVARGLSNAQMAERLAISAKTIDSHRTSLMRKMGVHSSAALLVRAIRLGLIDV